MNLRILPLLTAVAAATGAVSGAAAQTGNDAAQPARPKLPDCSAEEHRQFDFWLGEWDVTVDGKPAGHNRIEKIEQGCGLAEHWAGAQGGTGVSYNAYDRSDGHWHQFWVSNHGSVLRLKGGMEHGSMVMRGEMRHPRTGKMQPQRITWTPNADGSVRQHWEFQDEDGSWKSSFDGLYRKAR